MRAGQYGGRSRRHRGSSVDVVLDVQKEGRVKIEQRAQMKRVQIKRRDVRDERRCRIKHQVLVDRHVGLKQRDVRDEPSLPLSSAMLFRQPCE